MVLHSLHPASPALVLDQISVSETLKTHLKDKFRGHTCIKLYPYCHHVPAIGSQSPDNVQNS